VTLADKLKWILERKSMSQDALARCLGVSFVTMNSWVNGRSQPRPKLASAIDRIHAELTIAGASAALAPTELTLVGKPTTNDQSSSSAMSQEQLDQLLKGVGDSEAISLLVEAQRDELRKKLVDITELAPLDAILPALLLMSQAADANGAEFQHHLMYPQIATWAEACLASLLADDSDPFIVRKHLRHYSSIAATLAWRCGVKDFAITVPCFGGSVFLPSLGRAMVTDLGEELEEVRLICVDGAISLAANEKSILVPKDISRESEHWFPVRTIGLECNGLKLQLAIDDVDIYNFAYDMLSVAPPATRLQSLDFKSWTAQLADAWQLLVERHHNYAENIAQLLRVIVPVEPSIFNISSFFREGFGAIVVTIGATPAWTAHSMLDAIQYAKLDAIHSAEKLHTATSDVATYFDPSNVVPAPLNTLVEIFYAAQASVEFWTTHAKATFGEEELESLIEAHLRRAWQESLTYRLEDSGELTALGRRMLRLAAEGNPIQNQFVPEIVEFVQKLTIDYRMCFRLAYVKCDQSGIERLGRAWVSGMDCPTDPIPRQSITPERITVFGWKHRKVLRTLKLGHPDNFQDVLGNHSYLDIVAPGAVMADAYAVEQLFDKAFEGFSNAIAAESHDLEAWAGLASTVAWEPAGQISMLGRFPEIVAAVYQFIRETYGQEADLRALDRWLLPLSFRLDDNAYERVHPAGLEADSYD
jgi:HEXXH motif-containing protein